MMMDLPYSSINCRPAPALPDFSACLKVAEYSNAKPSADNLVR